MKKLLQSSLAALMMLAMAAINSSAAETVISRISFAPGWNNTPFPVMPAFIGDAQTLSSALTLAGFDVPYIVTFNNTQGWLVYDPMLGSTNFTIDGTTAVWIYSQETGPVSYTFAGALLAGQARSIHLSPDAGAVDLLVDGQLPNPINATWGQANNFLRFMPGTYNLGVTPAGDPSTVVINTDLTVVDGSFYTGAAIGRAGDGTLQLVTYENDFSALADGDIRVRPIHGAATVGEVDVYEITDPGNPVTVASDVSFGGVGAPIDLPAGQYTLGIDTDNDTSAFEVQFTLPDVPAGAILDLFVAENPADQLVLVILSQVGVPGILMPDGMTPATADIRALHLIDGGPSVDVYANGNGVGITSLAYPNSSAFQMVPEGNYDIVIVEEGDDPVDVLIGPASVALTAGDVFTYVAWVDAGGNLAVLPLAEDLTAPATGEIRVRAIHAAGQVGEVDLMITDSSAAMTNINDVNAGDASGYVSLPMGSTTVGIDVDNDTVADLTFDLGMVPGGTVANVFATNDVNGDVVLVVQDQNGNTSVVAAGGPVAGSANVRGINLDAGQGNVELVQNAMTAVGSAIGYASGTMYTSVAAGTSDLGFLPEGGDPASDIFASSTEMLTDGGDYTAALVDGDVLVYEDDLTAPASAGDFRVRGIHAAPSVGEVDIYLFPAGVAAAPISYASDVPFGAAGPYADLAAGAYIIAIDADNNPLEYEAYFALPFLPAGLILNAFVSEDASGDLTLVAQAQDSSIVAAGATEFGFVRVVHALDKAGPADFFITSSGSPEFVGVGYQTASEYVLVSPGLVSVGVNDATANQIANIPDVPVSNNSYVTVVAGGDVQADIFSVVVEEDPLSFDPASEAQLQAVHLFAGVGEVNVVDFTDPGNPNLLIQQLDFNQASTPVVLAPGTIDLAIDTDFDPSTPELLFSGVTVAAGERLLTIVTADQAGEYVLVVDGTSMAVVATP